MKLRLLPLFLLFALGLSAQQLSIVGQVVDAQQHPLPGAHISLLHPWGETYKTTVSDAAGAFRIEQLGQGGYALTITFVGYAGHRQEVTLTDQNIDLGTIELRDGLALEQVEVVGQVPLAQQLGDTTQYNADAFKTLPDANAEELIEKMPGVVIRDGKVQAQGEEVQEVLVDGRPFFGNDPSAALRNLPAEVISKIQIFDQQSDQSRFTGFDDGETTKTINIVTRSEMRNAQFGKVYGGYGSDERYQAGGNVSLFNGDQRISIIGQSNNINQQNFATEDLLGVVGNNQRRGRRGGGGRGRGGRGGGGSNRGGGSSVNDFLVQQQDGIAQTHAFGINYSDRWNDQMEISGSYFFNHSDTDSDIESNTEYIDAEFVSEFYQENSFSNTQNTNHRLNLRFDYQIDSANSIVLRPRLTWQLNDGTSSTLAQSLLGSTLLGQTDNHYRSDLAGLVFSNSLLYRHRFAKPRRTISINFGQGYNQNQGESFLQSEDVLFLEEESRDTLDQFADLDLNGWNLSANLNYTEPIGRYSMLMLNYRASYQEDDSDRSTFDFAKNSQMYDQLNTDLSNIFQNTYQSQQTGLGFNYRKSRSFMFMLRANVQWSQLTSDERFPTDGRIQRTYWDVLPMAMLRFRASRQENLRIFYGGRTNSPSVEQLQEVLDNSNPLQLSIGNASLDQAYTHRVFARYSKTNTDKANVFYVLLGGSFSNNYISNSAYLETTDHPIFEQVTLPEGSQLSQPVNLSGYRQANTFITYGFPLTALKSNLNLDVAASYLRTPSLINDAKNISETSTMGLGVTISSNISERLDFTLSTRSDYNSTQNSLQNNQDANYWSQLTKLRLGWILPGGIVLRTQLNHQWYKGLSDTFDDSILLWTAAIGKKLFKNQRGELSLSVYDLLEQNQQIQRNINEFSIEDIRTAVLQRYVMLTFTYNFRNFKTAKKATDRKDKRDLPPWMR